MNSECKLILVSTFRHFYMSIGLALNEPNTRFYLIFIDQVKDGIENKVFTAAKSIGAPFSGVECLPVKSAARKKSAVRSLGFARLREVLIELKPNEIITGNDRRLEFQYAMHFCRSHLSLPIKGAFIDDGTGSYISFQNSKLFRNLSDKYIDTPLKKITYGRWYKRPEVFGASSWVDTCYLAHPNLIPVSISDKKIIELKREFYTSCNAREYFERFSTELDDVTFPSEANAGVLFVLPHSSMINGMYGSIDNLKNTLLKVASKYSDSKIYFKYHPRELGDPLSLETIGCSLTSAIPAELYYSMYDFDLIIGDVSTALMAAKWLIPEADVRYLPVQSVEGSLVARLFQKLDIKPLNIEART